MADNLEQIKALKEDAAESKLMRSAADKAAAESGAENRRLAELLTKVAALHCGVQHTSVLSWLTCCQYCVRTSYI